AVDVKYHERAKPEIPKPENLARYIEVAERSGAFADRAIDAVTGKSDLAVIWLEHLLMHSLLQHENRAYTWGRYVVIHPAGNADVADMAGRYRELLADDSSFATLTLEALLDSGVLPAATALRERYL